ncbi:MAG: tol-pal system protein YbgF [Deltaproteobacteria bacterium]|nr:tol-pal system protein YbgF [Deltaproteobacteria bacterium]MBW2068115.1 tol-pal system protein YbgF [Deltaproteobacteria bacterium]
MRYGAIFLILCMTLCSVGCVTTQEQVLLQQRVVMLEQRVNELEKHLEEPTGADRQAIADINARLDELQMKLGKLEGKLEEHDRKLANVPTVMVKPITEASNTQAAATSTSPSNIPKPSDEKSAYEGALKAFHDRNYKQSEENFKAFLKRYPDSPLADNALFWLGEIYFIRGDYLKAIEYYQKLLDTYPKGNKVPIAMFKQGKAWEKLGDTTAARILYEKVINKYPNTAEARLAKKAMEALK